MQFFILSIFVICLKDGFTEKKIYNKVIAACLVTALITNVICRVFQRSAFYAGRLADGHYFAAAAF